MKYIRELRGDGAEGNRLRAGAEQTLQSKIARGGGRKSARPRQLQARVRTASKNEIFEEGALSGP